MDQVIAMYLLGLFIFALNGMILLGIKSQTEQRKRQTKILKHLLLRGRVLRNRRK